MPARGLKNALTLLFHLPNFFSYNTKTFTLSIFGAQNSSKPVAGKKYPENCLDKDHKATTCCCFANEVGIWVLRFPAKK